MRQDAEELVLPLVERRRVSASMRSASAWRASVTSSTARSTSDGRSARSIDLVFSTSVRGGPGASAPSRGSRGLFAAARLLQRRRTSGSVQMPCPVSQMCLPSICSAVSPSSA